MTNVPNIQRIPHLKLGALQLKYLKINNTIGIFHQGIILILIPLGKAE